MQLLLGSDVSRDEREDALREAWLHAVASHKDDKAFCPTGAGGGVDNSCGSGTGSGSTGGDSGKTRTQEATPSQKTKAEIAKASAVLIKSDEQRYAEERNEPYLAKKLGGTSFPDAEPVDIAGGDYRSGDEAKFGIELKTKVTGKEDRIYMKASAQERKADWEQEHNAEVHCVVFDDRNVFNANGPGEHGPHSDRDIYYRRGGGNHRISGMYKVKDMAELKTLIATPAKDLPDEAKPTKEWKDRQKRAARRAKASKKS